VVQAGLKAAGLSVDDRDSAQYKRHYRDSVYETLFALADENLPGVPVVVAGPFTRESQDAGWLDWLRARFGTEVQVHFVWAEPEVRRGRMRERGATRDLPKLEQWESYLATCAQERPPFAHVFVDGAAS
jgi:predicted kinase